MERRLFENVLSMIICTFVNKVRNLKIWSLKTHVMNFEHRGHIVWNAEPKKQEGKWLSKKGQQASTKDPTKEQSLDTQQTDSGLMAVKTDSYTEGRAGQAPARNKQTLV